MDWVSSSCLRGFSLEYLFHVVLPHLKLKLHSLIVFSPFGFLASTVMTFAFLGVYGSHNAK